jgi:hypothetical protein
MAGGGISSYGLAARRRYSRERYDRHYRGGTGHATVNVTIPADVERRAVHTPCFACGEARGACRHRPWAAAL